MSITSKNRKTNLKRVLNETGTSFGIPVINVTERVVNAIEKWKCVDTVGGAQFVNPMHTVAIMAELPELFGDKSKEQCSLFYVFANTTTLPFLSLCINPMGACMRTCICMSLISDQAACL